MDQYIGRLLDDRYEILEVLGTGGMAVVYKARCHRLNRLVAIKILKDEFARDEEFRRRFHAEGEAVAMLSHPNIVQVYDVSSSDNANFIVMELIDGISLKQYMEKKGVLNWKETLHFAMQIAKGLEHAHSRGIVHRDIKPHNVMVLKNGSVKVMDFGIARVMNKSNTLTKEALGSVHYISPEQAKGGFTDNRSDLYSLSVVMYEMMTGRPPYDGESAVAVAIQHINGGAVMPSALNPNIPSGLEQIIMKGMALEIQDRYPSATELLQDMEEFRKNPAIVFSYHSVIDDATRPIGGIGGIARTTAEKVVQAKTGMKSSAAKQQSRVSTDSARLRQVSGAASVSKRTSGKVGSNTGTMTRAEAARRARLRQQMEEKQRQEERRARVTTTAIVVCSAVAIIAIIAFLVALFNGALLNQENDYVEVPYLIGEMYGDDLMQQYDDFVILLQPQEYNDEYAKGMIIRQEPAGGSRVKKKSDLRITVSLGAEPEVKVMDDYIGYAQEGVKAALEGQGFKPIFREEASDLYKAGEIIRTDPVAGTELQEGQTIKIWVSTGPDIILQKMPDVVGMELDVAQKLLNQLGFENIRTRPVESDKPKDTVVYQSEKHNDEIDVNTEILLEISEGPEETEPTTQPTQPPTAPPTEPPTAPPMVTANVTFQLPVKEAMYVLTVYQGGVQVVGATQIQPGTSSYTVALTGIGSQSYDIYVDGIPYDTQTVEFSNG